MFLLWQIPCRENLWQVCKSNFLSASNISTLPNLLKCSSCHFLTGLRRGSTLEVGRRGGLVFGVLLLAEHLCCLLHAGEFSYWRMLHIYSVACQQQLWVIGSRHQSSRKSGRSRTIRCPHLFSPSCTEWSKVPSFFQISLCLYLCLQILFYSYHIDKCDNNSCLSFQTAWKSERFMNLLILEGIINGNHQASMLNNIKTYYLFAHQSRHKQEVWSEMMSIAELRCSAGLYSLVSQL